MDLETRSTELTIIFQLVQMFEDLFHFVALHFTKKNLKNYQR